MESENFIVTIPMPFAGESIVDGILMTWLVEPGQKVHKGQNLAEIETEKSVWEFESPCDGEVISLKAEVGDVVDVEAPLIDIRTSDRDVIHLSKQVSVSGGNGKAADQTTDRSTARRGNMEPKSTEIKSGPEIRLSPRVKRLCKEHNIDRRELTKLDGSGPGGKVLVEDVENYLKGRGGRVETRQNRAGRKLGADAQGSKAPRAVSQSKTGAGPSSLYDVYISGLGTYVPESVVENTYFEKYLSDIDPHYMEKVTGIQNRRWVNGSESTSDIAYKAALEALENAETSAGELDLIILATSTPDMPLPASACVLQQKLGCRTIPAFDLQAACSGWLYGLSVARQFIANASYGKVLVVAAEAMSRYTDPADRATAFLFGDGAGAAVLSSEADGHLLSDIVLQADGSGYDIIYRKAGGAVMPYREMTSPKDEYWSMDGGRMFRSAVEAFSRIIQLVAEKSQLSLEEFDWFIPHQANQRILKAVAKKVKTLPEKFFSNIKHLGNTSAASIPLALRDLERNRQVRSGEKLLLCSVGAGLTYAGCVLTWR